MKDSMEIELTATELGLKFIVTDKLLADLRSGGKSVRLDSMKHIFNLVWGKPPQAHQIGSPMDLYQKIKANREGDER